MNQKIAAIGFEMTRNDHQTVNNELPTQPRRIAESDAELEEAEIVAVNTAAITLGLSLFINLICFLAASTFSTQGDLTTDLLSWTFSSLIFRGMAIAPASLVRGWLAYTLFHQTNIRVATASKAFSAISMLTLIVWIYIVFFCTKVR